MAKKKQIKTNAIRIVEQKKIPYQEHTYTFSENDLGAKHVAEELNQNEAQIFKTLVAVGNKTGPVVAVIPSNQELDLKKIAKESGNKKVEMLHLKDLENLTGYIRGGCSPVGMKKLFPTYFDQSALNFATIMVSAGKRGVQMELAPNDLAGLVRGKFVDLTLEK
ncbi:Cys-tRNA(Pro) deacylase [Enterococcus cecorum]|uniref:Cys-tRNA(Pro)/Cys-tRNA(Cys) deacylase n=1 Tax=Enterococcus cecorum DSM 20682 = ATCC 43198 TaxID=1121864 RepID=S1RNA1_9ENTE|nr:Cys-tRNA(Pro) deacylase [Enterococcus cecorum]EOX19415.1 YbaK/EbsC protein [Enterococcus cecorum DSM 20682 = ATCC 43198]ESK61925.1 YbaK/EbsC protein [Enterococcus cecorum DSM 20682 = ATCC 43198]KLN91230.1 cysteinyl-tRNA(Pro) deacylase [Enterococcus cecorum]KLN93079.1 cysteinyl-tRNA(Pro) deacylase [Enterococcus cecorum]KLO64837.1 cysteinyl-tRNA(Pro) deacylase [Enterococcus cecorum]